MDACAAKIAGCPRRHQDVAAYEPQVSDVSIEASYLWVAQKRAYRIVGSGSIVMSGMARRYVRKRSDSHCCDHTFPTHARFPLFSCRPSYGTVAQRGVRVRSFMLRGPQNRKRRWRRRPQRRSSWPSTGRYAMWTVSEVAFPTVSVYRYRCLRVWLNCHVCPHGTRDLFCASQGRRTSSPGRFASTCRHLVYSFTAHFVRRHVARRW